MSSSPTTSTAFDDTTFESSFVSANGLRFHVVMSGPKDGKPVLLLHGFPEFWYSWRHQLRALAQAGYRAIAPDLRGYNLSDKPQGIENYRTRVLMEDVVALVAALGYSAVDLVGHDWGGAIAWAVAASAEHRHVVHRLTVVNAPHPAAFVRRMSLSQLRRSWYMLFFQLPFLPEKLISKDGFATLRRMLAGSAERGAFSQLDLDRFVEAMAQPGALTCAVNYYRAMLRQNLVAELRRLSTIPASLPVLLVWGERDPALGKELTYNLHTLVDNLRIEYVPDAGHWVQQERPDVVNRALLSFLESKPR
ncbi:MAG: alpha/beta fold hydrolase [Myxococcales bacterium]|nr:alpha/beta fold hydrolase [Myxococcales bacterium]